MSPYYEHAGITIYQADALDLLRSLPDAFVDLVATDPPFFGVREEEWDNAWRNEREFLRWFGALCKEWRRTLKPNGSVYVFASPQMAHGVERVVRRHLRVLNHIVWRKERARHKGADQDALRCYFPQTERVLLCERFDADDWADATAEYSATCNALRRGAFGEYLQEELRRAGVSQRDAAKAIGAYGTVNHGGAVSNWILGYNTPSQEQYEALRTYLNGGGEGGGYLLREYSELAAAYAAEAERKAAAFARLDATRRPFTPRAGTTFTDVWDFSTVAPYPGKHPCEKPLTMMEHIISTSTRPGGIVVDAFGGSGTTAVAARNLGRLAITGYSDPHWCAYAACRLSQEVLAL